MTKEGIKFKTKGLSASLEKSTWLTNPSGGKRPSKKMCLVVKLSKIS